MTIQQLEASFHRQLQPKGSAEMALFRQFVNAAWNLRLISDRERQLNELAGGDSSTSSAIPLQQEMNHVQRRRWIAESVFYRSLNRLTKVRDTRLRRSPARITPELLTRLRASPYLM